MWIPSYGLGPREIVSEKRPTKQALSSSEYHSAHSIPGELSSFEEGKASTVSVFLELYHNLV